MRSNPRRCVGHLKLLPNRESQRHSLPPQVCALQFFAGVLLTAAGNGHNLDSGGRQFAEFEQSLERFQA